MSIKLHVLQSLNGLVVIMKFINTIKLWNLNSITYCSSSNHLYSFWKHYYKFENDLVSYSNYYTLEMIARLLLKAETQG